MRSIHTTSRNIALAATALALAWGGTVIAQQEQGKEPPSAAEFIKRLDKDGDGKVSKAEFDGPDEHFTASDKNKDGYISEDEAPTGPPPGQRGPGRGNRNSGDKERR